MITASWYISLDCRCPFCKTWVDLVDGDSFDFHNIQPAEEKEIEAECPECHAELLVKTYF